jgi:uncharacterized protein YdcH (DUF465 family)
MILCRMLQDVQASFRETSVYRLHSEEYEYTYCQQSKKLRELRKKYNQLADEHKRYEGLFHQYDEVYQQMHECVQIAEEKNDESCVRVAELEKSNQQMKEELYSALAKIDKLEAATVSQDLAQLGTHVEKRRRLRPISCHE